MKFRSLIKGGVVAAFLLSASISAWSQGAIQQAGPVTPGHPPMFVQNGVVADPGTAAGGGVGVGLSELGLAVRGSGTAPYANAGTGPNGENVCDYDAPVTNAMGYHYLCFSPNALGGGLISYGAGGIATPLPLQIKLNGVLYQFPGTGSGNVLGPVSTVVNNIAIWNNTSGTLLADSGVSYTSLVSLGGTNLWTGPQTFTSGDFILKGSVSGTTTVNASSAASGIVTVPAVTDTLIGKATTDTLTNKTFDTAGTGNSLSIAGVAVTANTGTGAVTRATSPTLVTPTLGVATATSVNKVAITAPASSATLTINDGKTLTVATTSIVQPPTQQNFVSGSGTYTTPAGATWLEIRMVGGGGGGAGSGSGSPGSGGNGNNATFSTLTASGGAGGSTGSGTGATGGTGTNGDINLTGGTGGGGGGSATTVTGGAGGSTPFGSTASPASTGNAGIAAIANTGAGGSGASGSTVAAGGGGGGGGYIFKIISSPSATYSYGVGAGGSGGTAGTSGQAGGSGGSGAIFIIEHYN